MVKRLGRGALFLLITLVVAELALRLGTLVVHDRASGWRPGAIHRIVCLGDSHTYGALVEPEESYPAQLQGFLDEGAPGAYAVMNLGVPGLNTMQVLNRLPVEVGRHHPELVIVWAGINDAWNRAETDSRA